MRDRRLNSARAWALSCLLSCMATATVLAQQPVGPVAGSVSIPRGETLVEALTCRLGGESLPVLMQQLRRQRPDDFQQAYRQYSTPAMDLYRLRTPLNAWGLDSDSVLISDSRVMMAVEGSMDAVAEALETALQSTESPLGGALDEAHALVVMNAGQPGLEGMVLLGCEYRMPGLSLLQDPADAWPIPQPDIVTESPAMRPVAP